MKKSLSSFRKMLYILLVFMMVTSIELVLEKCFAFAEKIVITTSDGTSGTTAVYDTETESFSDDVLPVHQDACVKTDGTFLYIVSALGSDAVSKYNPSSISPGNEIFEYSVGANSNPRDLVFANSKGYVIRYDSDKIWVIDTNAENEESFKISEIDLASFADGDGLPEMDRAFVYNDMVYVMCQVLDRDNSWIAGTAVLVKIDSKSDTVVDSFNLMVQNPWDASLLGSKLYIADNPWGSPPQGLMTIDLSDDDPESTQVLLIDEETIGGACMGVKVFSEDYGIFFPMVEWAPGIPVVFNPQTGAVADTLSIPDMSSGYAIIGGNLIAMDDNFLYVGTPAGLYIVDPATNNLVGDVHPTSIPVYSLVYVGDNTPDAVSESEDIPESFSVKTPYPNPFNPSTTISFYIGEANNIHIDIFNVTGQKVDTLLDTFMRAGYHSVVWNAVDISSGIYYIRISNGISSHTEKVTFIK